VQRVVKLFPSHSRPARVLTDAGPGYVKGLFSPSGSDSLAAELVCAELATLIGLSVPPFAVIQNSEIEVPMLDWHTHMGVPLFFSSEIENALTSDGSDTFLKKLDRPADVAKLVMFDTWVRNRDRFNTTPSGGQSYNRDNLLFGPAPNGRLRVQPIDHANCFVGTGGTFEGGMHGAEVFDDKTIYGLFPEFAPFMNSTYVAEAAEAILAVSEAAVREIVNSIPVQWGVLHPQRERLVEVILERAKRVSEFAPPLLVPDPKLALVQPNEKGGIE
jgi:hypothetical protein